jgi:hypothetical protein
MKRAPLFVLAGTVAGFAGILSFHTRPAAPAALAGPASHARAGTHPARQVTVAPSQRPAAAPSQRPATPAGSVRSAVGPIEPYGYGQLAVEVTARGNHITNVTVPTLQTNEPFSQQLASQAIPTLRSEVLSGQTANINAVSGATYTSQAYAKSLQAALDKLQIN